MTRAARLVRAAPVTAVLFAVVWGLGLVAGSVRHPLRHDLETRWGSGGVAFAQHQWWTPLTSAFLAADLSGYVVVTALLVACGLAETRLRSGRTLALLAACQVGGCALAAMLVLGGARPGWFWLTELGHSRAVGLGPGLFGVAAAATAAMGVLWRRRARVSLFGYLTVMVLYSGQLSDLQHMAGALVGLLLGPKVADTLRTSGGGPVSIDAPPSRREARILVFSMLLATGLGPVVASLHVRSTPPMTAASQLLVTSAPAPAAVRAVCGQPGEAALCEVLRSNLHAPPPDALLLAALPVLLTLVFADGLRRGRRAAWWGALLTQVGSAGVVLGDLSAAADWNSLVTPAVVLMTPPVAMAVLLLVTRHAFAVRAATGTYRRTLMASAALLLAALVLHLAIVLWYRKSFLPNGTVGGAILDFLARLVPTPLVARPSLVPTRPSAAVLAGSTAPVFWLLLLGILVRTFWRVTVGEVEPDERRVARRILREHGTGTLSYLTMWAGQRYWFTEDRGTYVAYRVVGGVALTAGAPVGPPAALPSAVRGFAAYCDRQAWVPCFYSVTAEVPEAAAALGWQRLHVGDEAVLDLPGLTFTGRRWQDIRTARNKAARANVRPVWCALRHAPPHILAQVRQMSQEWLATKGLPEMGFTLGGVAEALDDNVRCLLAIDENEHVHALTSWLPVYRCGQVVGWTLDLMRRRRDSLPGAMEFLIATAAEKFQREGAGVLSLSGTPFTVAGDAGSHAATRLMVGAGRILEPVYGFRSLLMFKAKFQPAYRPLFLTFPDPTALPAIGNAVGRAYLPGITLRQAARMLRTVSSTRA